MRVLDNGLGRVALAAAKFGGLFFTGVSTGVAFGHVLEKAPKKELPGSTYVQVQTQLYRRYGRAGAVIEPAAFASAAALALLGTRNRTRALGAAAATIIALETGIWKFFIDPINRRSRTWTSVELPVGWTNDRDRWEAFHTIRAALSTAALAAMILGAVGTDR